MRVEGAERFHRIVRLANALVLCLNAATTGSEATRFAALVGSLQSDFVREKPVSFRGMKRGTMASM